MGSVVRLYMTIQRLLRPARSWCAICGVFLLCSAAVAGDVRTWEDCFERTVRNNTDLAIARVRLKEAEASMEGQRSVYYPSVSARASRGVSGRDTGQGWRHSDNVSASVQADYTLFDGFGNRARVSRSEAELVAERANFDQTCSNIEYTLRRAFSQQVYTQERIELLRDIANRRADNVRLVEMRYEGGREHKGSLLLIRAQQIDADNAVREAHRALDLARRQLATVLGERVAGSFRLDGELRAVPPPDEIALNEWAERTPSYRSALADQKAAEQGFLLSRSTRFPTISANASAGRSGETRLDDKSWSAGVSVSVPLFRGGEIKQNIIASGLRLERTRLTAERTMLALLNQLQEALTTYRDRYDALQVQQELLTAAELRAEVARAQYQQGLISFQDWDNIENALIQSRRSMLSSRQALDLAEAAWHNALGWHGIDEIPGARLAQEMVGENKSNRNEVE